MKTKFLLTHFGLALSLALGCIVTAAQPPAGAADIAAKTDEYMNARLDAKGWGGSVLIIKNGKAIVEKGYGLADIEGKVPITHDTKFRIGSVTKQFTAALVLMLHEQKKLDVQDPVCKYIEPCPEAWAPVTLHHLLSMTSGITNINALPNWISEIRFKDLAPVELIAMVSSLPLKAKPGEKYEYSNTNFLILGAVLEKVTGESYEKLLTEKIIRPLGLTDTGVDDGRKVLPNAARGYMMQNSVIVPAHKASVILSLSAGSMYSTVRDLYTWQHALLNGRVFKNKATLDLMLTPNKDDYAYGLVVVTDRTGRKRVTHGGGIEGFQADSVYFPEEDLFIAAFTNHERGAIGELMAALVAIERGEQAKLPKKRVAIKLDDKVLDSYVGEYQLGASMTLAIGRGPDGLTLTPTGQSTAPLFAESESEFFLKIVDATIKFVKDDTGKVVGLEFTQAGRTTKASRKQSMN